MRVAPLLTCHHLSPAESTYVTLLNSASSQATRGDLATAAAAAGVAAAEDDRGPGSVDAGLLRDRLHVDAGRGRHAARDAREHPLGERVEPAIRRRTRCAARARSSSRSSAARTSPASSSSTPRVRASTTRSTRSATSRRSRPTRAAPRASRSGASSAATSPRYYPDKTFLKMIEAQKVQQPLYIDTSWLARRARRRDALLRQGDHRRAAGSCSSTTRRSRRRCSRRSRRPATATVPMFIGKYWSQSQAGAGHDRPGPRRHRGDAGERRGGDRGRRPARHHQGGDGPHRRRDHPHPVPPHDRTARASIAYQPGMVNGIYIAPRSLRRARPARSRDRRRGHLQDASWRSASRRSASPSTGPRTGTRTTATSVRCTAARTRRGRSREPKWWESGR